MLVAARFTRGPLSLRRLDDHPLYVMHYAGDYGFDQYLQTGVYPDQPASPAERRRCAEAWGCTVFAALNADGERLLGRNFDWYADHPALLLFTDPPDGYASVSMVDLWYLGYTGDSIGLFERQDLSRAPYIPFDGMNEMGVAVGMMALPSGNGIRDPALRTLEDLEVIRLVLDYAASVDQAIELLQDYNVRFECRYSPALPDRRCQRRFGGDRVRGAARCACCAMSSPGRWRPTSSSLKSSRKAPHPPVGAIIQPIKRWKITRAR